MILWTWELGPDGKRSIFPLWKLDSFSLKAARKTHCFIFLIKAIALVKFWSFMKATGSFRLQAGKSPDSIVSPNENNNRYGNQLSENNLPWHLFSWNGTVCPRCVFTQLWSCQETCFCENWELGPYGKTCIFHIYKLDNSSLKPARKTHWFIFLFMTATVLVKFLSFPKETRCLPLLVGRLSDCTESLNQGNNR